MTPQSSHGLTPAWGQGLTLHTELRRLVSTDTYTASETTHHCPLVPIQRIVGERMIPTGFVVVYEFAPREPHRVASPEIADCPISRVKRTRAGDVGDARSLAGEISAALTSTAKELAQVSQLWYPDHSHPLVGMNIHIRCHRVSFGSAPPPLAYATGVRHQLCSRLTFIV